MVTVSVFDINLEQKFMLAVLVTCYFWMDGVVQMLMNVRRIHASVMVASVLIHQEVIPASVLRACFQAQTAHRV
jgi:hypothetical protein